MDYKNNVVQHVDGVAGLKKHKMTALSIAFTIYCLTAAGAFGIEEMIPYCGPGMTILMLAIFPIIWASPICIAVSELSAFLPEESGQYVWTREAFGEMWGFCMGWWITITIYLCQASYVVLVVSYAERFIELSALGSMSVKVGMVLIFTFVNLLGIKEVSRVNTIFAIMVLAAFAFLVIVGFANWNYNPVSPFIPPGQGIIDSLGLGICISIWMYTGYGSLAAMAGEIENPEVIPKGFKIAIPLIAISYILPTMAGLASVGNWEIWGIGGEAAKDYSDVFTQNLGPIWGVIFLVFAIIAQCAIFNAYILAGSRSFFVLGDDNLSPNFLIKLSKNRHIPYWPILIMAGVTMLLMNLDFSTILTIIAPIGIMCYVVLAFVFVKLRKKYPVEERGDVYYAKGGKPMVLYIVISPIIVGIIGLFVNGTEFFLIGFTSIFSGVVFYIIFKRLYGGLNKKDPIKHPINPKTKLAIGDTVRIGGFFVLFGLLLFTGSLFLTWYEGDWGAEYYLEVYETGLQSNFWLMIKISRLGGIGITALGLLIYLIGKKKDDIPVEEYKHIY